ncbi:MAG: PSD1 and planctomycete cytochrome C domain-containing protein [Mariniblastus sp.]|nr:PSD1 and planctomycete cytochrome C domain-containing protein [Mariniblastus sp.]
MANRKISNWNLLVTLLIGSFSASLSLAQQTPGLQFNRDIRPILSAHCYQCHGPDEEHGQAGLRLDTETGIHEVFGETDLDQNTAWQRLQSKDPDEQMPPPTVHSRISREEIDRLRRWIGQGAPFEEHWSFRLPIASPPPSVNQTDWVRNPIDRFVLAKLESKGWRPGQTASRQQLIRRLTLDLTGLPPTPSEIDSFLADQQPGAYQRLVDRLLQSPHLGERLAVPWLDAARYADTNGFSIDDHRDMWLWREWVIDAFNQNMPYDQFLTEQLAGDLLEGATDRQRLATGFLRNSMNTHEGGTLPEEYRVIYLADKVDTVATVFLGLTVRCAQCHDHKYDPISQQDYYRFYAFFDTAHEPGSGAENGNTEPTLRMDGPLTSPDLFRQDIQQRIDTLRQYLVHPPELVEARSAWEKTATGNEALQKALSTEVPARDEDDWKAINQAFAATSRLWNRHVANIEREIGFLQRDLKAGQSSVMVMKEQGPRQTYVLTRGQYDLPDKSQPVQANAPAMLPKLQFQPPEPAQKQAEPVDPWQGAKWIWNDARAASVPQDNRPKYFRHRFQLAERPGSAVLRVTADNRCTTYLNGQKLGNQQPWMTPARYEITPHLVDGENVIAVEAVNAGGPAGLLASLVIDNQVQQMTDGEWFVSDQPTDDWTQVDFDNERWERAVELGPANMAPWKMAHRPSVPAVQNQPSRLDLARWLVDERNPLTARVAVNRYWQMLFGQGLVRTPNDFGAQGTFPTHPKLLDWLAIEFRQQDWNVKQLLKTIVMSATYRQSAAASPDRFREDPQNEWLGRASRFRLPAEFIRDGAMAIAGTLDPRVGGPSVYPRQPHGLWREISHFGYTKPFSAQAFYPSDPTGQSRRSLYTFWKRTSPPPSMIAFDAPTREVCSVERSRTNTPLQALVLLNDPQYVQAARELARRTIDEGGASIEQRAAYLFRLATSRQPDQAEREILVQRYRSIYQQFCQDPVAARDLARDQDAELAAWTAIASIVLNLDEVITRE